MLFWLFLALVSVVALFPELPVAKFLRRWLVEKPAAFLNDLTWRGVAVWCGLFLFLLVASVAAPEIIIVLTSMGDTAFAFEIWMALWASGAASGATGLWRRLRQAVAAVSGLASAFVGCVKGCVKGCANGRARARRMRRKEARRSKPPSDDPEPGWAMLAAQDFLMAA